MLDHFDREILNLLQHDNRMPQRVIAERVNLSAPAVQRRIRRLEDEGTIMSNVALVDPRSVGRSLTVIAEVVVESEQREHIDEIKDRFAQAPEVQQCYYVTGEYDLVLIMLLATMEEYEELTRRLFFVGGNVRKFRTAVAMDRVKFDTALPLSPEQ